MRETRTGAVKQLHVGRRLTARMLALLIPLSSGALVVPAATPPATVNYQGVLRDQSDMPLTGSYDMTLRFMDAATGGDEILVDQHTAAGANAVTVSGGLFNVALGAGTVVDGSGPGTYISLDEVFRDYGAVWLEIQVGAETLSPRTRFHSSAFSLNTTNLGGHPDSYFLDTSSDLQFKSGRLVVASSDAGNPAIQAEATAGGGYGVNAIGETIGVFGRALGNISQGAVGGEFLAYGAGSMGVYASGDQLGVNAVSTLGTGVLASGPDYGIDATSSSGFAGNFTGFSAGLVSRCSSQGCIGVSGFGSPTDVGGAGVYGRGATGGFFRNTSQTIATYVASSTKGISTFGGDVGGWFETTKPLSVGVYAAGAEYGVDASGGTFGGSFQGLNSGSYGIYATGADHGVDGEGGNYGGYFEAFNTDSYGVAAFGVHTGVFGKGQARGGYFTNFDGDYAVLADASGYGIYAHGTDYGGHFEAFSTSNWAELAVSTWKVRGVGVNSFVQNHPSDSSKVIVYVSPEGDEAAVYTRGSGRLVNGEARVRLGETFALVANPDIGLTATVTPRGEPIPLAVSEVSPGEVVVRGPAGSSAEFDYMVWGLRIGFEEMSVVEPKRQDAKIPSMHEHEQFFSDEPELRKYTALARFRGVEADVRGKQSVDFSRADLLREAIGVAPYRPPDEMAHEPGRHAGAPPPTAGAGTPHSDAAAGTSSPGRYETPSRNAGAEVADQPSRQLVAGDDSFTATRVPADRLDLFAAEGTIEPGDVVSLTPAAPGSVTRSIDPTDSLVIGCAQPVEADATGKATAHLMPAGKVAIAASHVALCRVDASFGPIAVGDRLSPSFVAGTAMRLDPTVAGAIELGRAIDPLASGVGLVRVLLGGR